MNDAAIIELMANRIHELDGRIASLLARIETLERDFASPENRPVSRPYTIANKNTYKSPQLLSIPANVFPAGLAAAAN